MSKTVDCSIDLIAYSGAPTNDPATADKLFARICDTAITGTVRYQRPIPTATVNLSIPLAAASVNYLFITTDTPLTVVINGGASQALTPLAQGTKTFVLALRGAVTSLTISNASGQTADVDIFSAV